MKTYNQFDASIKMLSKHIPIFLRNAYGAFVKTEGEALTAILRINEKSPYTAKKIIDEMFGDNFYADALSTKTNGHVNTGDVLGAFKLTPVLLLSDPCGVPSMYVGGLRALLSRHVFLISFFVSLSLNNI